MIYNSQKHHRRSIRIPGYDYAQEGWYFITICTYQREKLFGEIINKNIKLNKYGKIVYDEWIKSSKIRHEIEINEFIIMPNHLHGIIKIIGNNCGRGYRPVAPTNTYGVIIPSGPYPKSIGSLIAGFKSSATKQINIIRQTPGSRIWQRNYWEHIIRDEKDLNRIRQYIINNPLKWPEDKYFS